MSFHESNERLQDWLAEKMRQSAGNVPKSKGAKPNYLQRKIMEVMADGRERTTSDICTKLGIEGRTGESKIRGTMNALHQSGSLAKGRVNDGRVSISIYTLAHEPHVSCKDRIAAAVKEAGQ